MEPDGREGAHHRGFGECFRQEEHIGVVCGNVCQEPLPEVQRFCVRVVHTECGDAMGDPQPDDAVDLLVDPLWVVVKVQGVDILVFFGGFSA